MNCALILAGGSGTRFWPKSTDEKPKQFLSLIDDKTMLQLTYDRINKIIDKQNIFIVVKEEHIKYVKEQIENINNENIIIQPSVRNTAPCILMATNYIKSLKGNTNLVVLPSDHSILKEDKFNENILKAISYIENNDGIVTIGINPTRPEVGYGYINTDNFKLDEISKINKFSEKPNLETAIKYLKSGNYLWNAGIFVFNSNYILSLYKSLLTNMYLTLNNLPEIKDINYLKELKEKYLLCEDISFDKGIMEKTDKAYVIPSDILWDDLGTWASLERYIPKDLNDNILKGNITCHGKNNIIYSDCDTIIEDVDNVFVVYANNQLIITNKEKINEIHKLKIKEK